MNVTVRNEYRTEVLLSDAELEAYGVTYEELDYSDPETRRVLWTIAADIRRLSGTDFTLSGRLLIEVFKESPGITKICFTRLEKEKDSKSIKQLVKSECVPLAVRFSDIEDVISFCLSVRICEESILFENDGIYILILYSSDVLLAGTASEYGSLCEHSRRTFAECSEMWHCIISRNAADTIRKAFSENQ